MSIIESFLPVSASLGVDLAEDVAFAIAFTAADGSPASLDGITLTLTIGAWVAVSTTGGAGANIATVLVPLAARAAWPAGVWPMRLVATDGAATKALFGVGSSLTLGDGQASPLVLRALAPPPAWATVMRPAQPVISGGGVTTSPAIGFGLTGILTPGGMGS